MGNAWMGEIHRFRDEVRSFLKSAWNEELEAESARNVGYEDAGFTEVSTQLLRAIAEKGWLGISLPKESGGGGRSIAYQYALWEELSYVGVPLNLTALFMVAPVILRLGSEEQRRRWIPDIASGTAEYCLGYTEPDAGSDLASLRTRAVRSGDVYVVNGQKVFTTAAHYATHVWLAVRTDPAAPEHRGISMLLVDMTTPGITVRPLWTQGEGRTNEVFFEDVRVPVTDRVGAENEGWRCLTEALDLERVAFARVGPLRRGVDELVALARARRVGLTHGEAARLGEIMSRVDAAELLFWRCVEALDRGEKVTMEASTLKVVVTELNQQIGVFGLELMGRQADLGLGAAQPAHRGIFHKILLGSPMARFGGGSNEIQRNIIAQRGLGLPRA